MEIGYPAKLVTHYMQYVVHKIRRLIGQVFYRKGGWRNSVTRLYRRVTRTGDKDSNKYALRDKTISHDLATLEVEI